ncbi:MAG: UDP-2,3-diacylglucosamine diphosphatase LpxI [Armatimonadota bacterium]|nr:UDP-2,3-diacylglucosamine diphosphatase LpxI [Armatimonadota bacterium]MDR7426451.1 UDP-2,3-diacylglucosamine diphosphatase LpxI [Armatimonadota bacterium]MDR7470253.1 UDP-2,3-diacylglucosamine diphosphatase LpxI [Armatimonadota bacterium]MDR7473410.1 UDP-2,3-diacylglucosamine diphosphatase LpxI [Armatimonadota bacterium]MDR7538421.1 UDP-2,3-diacylglucosamine diphosphatase LpxI [Armatimonadota bacterium]
MGLLAGEGRLPEVLARAVRARGRRLVCVQMAGETPALEHLAHVFARLAPEQWEELEALWHRHAVREVLLAGRFRRGEMVARLLASGSDLRGFLERLPERGDQQILDALARRLAAQGIRVLDQLAYVPDLVAPPGLLAGTPLSPAEERDVRIGLAVGRALAAHEVGQTVVLKHGAILAVEAAEGTDAAIRRGTAMAPGAVVVKVSRPQQDPRFDLPTVGPETVEVMRAGRARVLAVEAFRTIVLERLRLAARAEEAGISVFAVEASPLGPRPGEAR